MLSVTLTPTVTMRLLCLWPGDRGRPAVPASVPPVRPTRTVSTVTVRWTSALLLALNAPLISQVRLQVLCWLFHLQLFIPINLQSKHYKLSHPPVSLSLPYLDLPLPHFITWSAGTVCSGKGTCRYSDPSGNRLYNCTILDVTCTASCVCNSGLGGSDCSMNTVSLTARDSVR